MIINIANFKELARLASDMESETGNLYRKATLEYNRDNNGTAARHEEVANKLDGFTKRLQRLINETP